MVIFHSYVSYQRVSPVIHSGNVIKHGYRYAGKSTSDRSFTHILLGFCRFSPPPGAIFASRGQGRPQRARRARAGALLPGLQCAAARTIAGTGRTLGTRCRRRWSALLLRCFFLEVICGCLSTIKWEMYGYLSHKKAVVFNLMISNNDIYGCLTVQPMMMGYSRWFFLVGPWDV